MTPARKLKVWFGLPQFIRCVSTETETLKIDFETNHQTFLSQKFYPEFQNLFFSYVMLIALLIFLAEQSDFTNGLFAEKEVHVIDLDHKWSRVRGWRTR